MLMIKILLFTCLIVIVLTIIIGKYLSTTPYNGPISDHFNGKRFKNPSGRPAKGFKDVGKYIRTRQRDVWPPIQNPYIHTSSILRVPDDQVQYVWINHSTFLIQIDGVTILTDPIFSTYCSPVPVPPMKRHRPPGVSLELLPDIDLVLVSHNHYDHMDKWSISQISKRWNPQFICPLGNKSTLEAMGASQVIEIDWWDSSPFKSLNITATPTNHFSSRGLYDRNTSLWSGFMISGQKRQIYFLGDSGYSDIFKDIRNKLGHIDLSLIPIGAYRPRWFMGPIHISPEEAVQVHKDLQSPKSVAMHFGTFALADDNPERAISEFAQEITKQSITEEEFSIVEEGRIHYL